MKSTYDRELDVSGSNGGADLVDVLDPLAMRL
jgi:hypothetical protein